MIEKKKDRGDIESASQIAPSAEQQNMNLVPAGREEVAAKGAFPVRLFHGLEQSIACADQLFLTMPNLRIWHMIVPLACSYVVPAFVYGAYWTIHRWMLSPIPSENILGTFLKEGNYYGSVALLGGVCFCLSFLLLRRLRSSTDRSHLVLWVFLLSFMLPYLSLGVFAHWKMIVEHFAIQGAVHYFLFDAFLFAFGLPGAMGGVTAASTFLLFNLGKKSTSASSGYL